MTMGFIHHTRFPTSAGILITVNKGTPKALLYNLQQRFSAPQDQVIKVPIVWTRAKILIISHEDMGKIIIIKQ